MFFERFNVPGIYIAPQPLLALYGCGAVSGIAVDIGEESTRKYWHRNKDYVFASLLEMIL